MRLAWPWTAAHEKARAAFSNAETLLDLYNVLLGDMTQMRERLAAAEARQADTVTRMERLAMECVKAAEGVVERVKMDRSRPPVMGLADLDLEDALATLERHLPPA